MHIVHIRSGDTEIREFVVTIGGRDNLDEVSSILFYGRFVGETTNHINGIACSVVNSADRIVQFDPRNNGPAGADAFDVVVTRGQKKRLQCHVVITWTDGQETVHPAEDDGSLDLYITPRYSP